MTDWLAPDILCLDIWTNVYISGQSMRFNNPLACILDSKPKIVCLRLLCNHPTDINGRQLSKIVGLSATTVHKAMKELAEEQIIFLKNYGNSHLYSLNEQNIIVAEILKPLFSGERILLQSFIKKIVNKIKKLDIKNRICSVALFGSVYEGTEKADSDIDFCVIVRNSDDKRWVEEGMFDINSSFMPQIGMRIEAYIKTVAEFKKDKELSVIKSILKSHQLIYGSSLEKIK